MSSAESASHEVVVGVLADPGLPATVADGLAARLGAVLPGTLHGVRITWRISTVCDPFEALEPDYERLLDKARQRVHATDWDIAVCLTDTPLRDRGSVVVAELGAKDPIAVLSLPALGGSGLLRRVRRLAAILIEHLAPDVVDPGRPRPALHHHPHLRRAHTVRISDSDATDISAEVVVVSPFGLPRLIAGMVRANRPWRLVWGLSGALGGALAGSAFGVFYSSIWHLADSLPPARLLALAAAAIAVHVVWIIVGHGLWESNGRSGSPLHPGQASTTLRNLGTVLTVTFGITVFSATLYVLAFTASLLVITGDYLTATLQHPVGWGDYLRVALMSTVMGTIAGAVGSGLEDEATIREATYGHRERERARWD